ncbi:hypothetical protein [Streptomyces sp. NPDC054838]
MTDTISRLPAFYPEGINPSRARAAVRNLYDHTPLGAHHLMAPLLALPDDHIGRGSLPGAVGISDVEATVAKWSELGIRGVKLFAWGGDARDEDASGAVQPTNLMIRAISAIKNSNPHLAVTTEVCGCSWTSHGECVLRTDDGDIDLDATYGLARTMAMQHADAGADVISPTAMLDGMITAVRERLNQGGHRAVGINPNLALHTSLYGPFKDLMGTNPASGNRLGLQLSAGGRAQRDTLIQAERWLAEGADSLTLQPVMTAVDVLVRLRDTTQVPLVAYSTSGEWAALQCLGSAGMTEYTASLKRAGADSILTYAAATVAAYLEDHRG